MFKRFRHIFALVTLLAGSLQALAQLALPDRVCVGTRHTYWVEGFEGSAFTWKIDGQVQRSTTNILEINWNDIGTFNLEVQEHQAKCDGYIRSGLVTVVEIPNLDSQQDVKSCGRYTLPEISGINMSGNEAYYDNSQAAGGSRIFGPITESQTIWIYDETGTEPNCFDQVSFEVVINKLKISASATDAKCFGENGSISFEFSNVTDGVYSIDYDGGQFSNVNIISNKATIDVLAGTYNNITIEAGGCISGEDVNITITQPNQIIIAESISEIDLKLQRKGSISLNVSGGSGTYSYSWNNGATTSEIKNLSDGTYTVWVTDENNCSIQKTIILSAPNFPPVTDDDEFIAGCFTSSGNLLENDSDPEGDLFFIDLIPVVSPKHGCLTIFPDGSFEYQNTSGYFGTDVFRYAIYDAKHDLGDTANVFISIIPDMDCDGVPDDTDQDADGDGILNADEGGMTTDTDGDGNPNYLDIDADNDGIPDYFEAQPGKKYKPQLNMDTDGNGVDDAFDIHQGGVVIIPVDTDADGVPDFLDADSDGDFVPDYIEGQDEFADGKADQTLTGKDSDKDGLDDAFDTINRYLSSDNMTGTNAAMQDFDGDGIPDWRDNNDDDDIYLTRFEDMNADGNFSNDDLDLDGHPEYLDLAAIAICLSRRHFLRITIRFTIIFRSTASTIIQIPGYISSTGWVIKSMKKIITEILNSGEALIVPGGTGKRTTA